MKTILLNVFILLSIFLLPRQGDSQNLLTDGNFSTTTVITPLGSPPVPLNTWCSWNNLATVTSFSATVTGGVCNYSFVNSGSNTWDVQLIQFGFPLIKGNHYKLTFDVMADANRQFGVFIGENEGNWTNLNSVYMQDATTFWKTRIIEFDATEVFALHKLSFEMGNVSIPMYFDNIILENMGPITTTRIFVPGSFQSEVGCSGDWQPDCANTELIYKPGTTFWEGTFNIPAGNYEYKVALNSTWDINYGANGVQNGPNILLNLPITTDVTFIYDSSTHIITNSYSNEPLSVNIPGSFQSEIGCAGDWDPTCPVTNLTFDNTMTGEWYGLYYIPAGNYEFKAAINNKWDENYGLNGQLNGPNIPLNLTNFSRVAFRYNPTTHITTTSIINNSITLAGSFQSELGCSSDWMPDCYFSSLNYNQVVNVWEGTFILPQGNYEFKVVVDNNWIENYGIGGVLNGPNYPLNISTVSRVNFTYYPASHIVAYIVEPITVVIPGDFQSELGCTPVTYINGDWEPACDFTRLTYDPVQKLFIDTFPIGKGHWEYKVAINNSWYENYGLYGQRDGPNIPLDLPFACHVIFKYDPISHYVFIDYATSGVCVNKFYDANVNGYMDYGEVPMEAVSFTLTGKNITLTQSSGSDGKTCFTNLPAGIYSVKETVPSGYISSTPDSQVVYLGAPANLYFGNVCLGPGGAKGIGFWSGKNGETALNNSGKIEDALWWLRYWSLRNADGTDFDPYTYAQLKTWMQGANAKNMTYMLSAQLATMYLNIEMGYVNYNSIIYTPGCGFTGNGNFMDVYALIWYTNYYLLYKTTSTGKDPDRAYLECLKNGFDNANNNLTFVQPQPCGATIVTVAERRPEVDVKIILPETEARVWPNPSNNYFTIRPANNIEGEIVQIRVMDINGKLVYTGGGATDKNYRFGDKFSPGLYFVEVIQSGKRSTIKIIKQ